MEEAIMILARAMNTNKGSSLGLHALLLAVIKSMPTEQRAQVYVEFDREIDSLRSAMPGSGVENEVRDGVESFVRSLEVKRN
jgi:hypothetical protein